MPGQVSQRQGQLPLVSASSLIGSSPDVSYLRKARSTQSSEPIPGPAGDWAPNRNRPFANIGKFPLKLVGAPSFEAGRANPYAQFAGTEAAPQPAPEEAGGFFTNLLGGLGGLTGVEPISGVGRFLGGLVDFPLETAGNVLGAPIGVVSSIPTWLEHKDDPVFIQRYMDEISKSPINAILGFSRVAQTQWEQDVRAGRATGLFSTFGPSSNLLEQLDYGRRLVQRGLLEFGIASDSIDAVEQYAMGRNPGIPRPEGGAAPSFYWQVAERARRGDFGTPGTEEFRGAIKAEIAVNNQILRSYSDVPQEGLLTAQGVFDMLLAVGTDPLIVGSLGFGGAVKIASRVAAARASTFFSVFGDDAVGIAERVAQHIADARGISLNEASILQATDRRVQAQGIRLLLQDKDIAANAEAVKAGNYYADFVDVWEPSIRGVNAVVQRLNNPLEILFGGDRAAKMTNALVSSHTTEGAIRAYGLDTWTALRNELSSAGADVGILDRGMGTYASFLTRNVIRGEVVKDVRQAYRLPGALPEEEIAARLKGLRGGDMATAIEQRAMRVKPRYLPEVRGGTAAALARAQEQALARMRRMFPTANDAELVRVSESLDVQGVALIDAIYFGHTQQTFSSALTRAKRALGASNKPVKPGQVDLERLTLLGPRELTTQRAEVVLDAVKRGDVSAVREARNTYDLLFDNIGGRLEDADLLKQVRTLIEEQRKAGGLTREIGPKVNLPKQIERWRKENADIGYRLGYKPDESGLWRVTQDAEGRIIGVNPWVDVTDVAAEVPTYTRLQLEKDRLFHNVRGERIMADARERFARFNAERFGLTGGESDALFARVVKAAQEAGFPPRALSAERIYNLFTTAKLGDEVLQGLTPREAIEALMHAFEGNFWKVGVTQKFTGYAKTALGGQHNWLGQIAEKIYPMVRFVYSPIFQLMEFTEPFVLNAMRGIKPGFVASELDQRTIELIDVILRQSKYAFDDQIERGNWVLWGKVASREGFGPKSRLGRWAQKLTLGDRLDVKRVKQINYARLARQQLGGEFEEVILRIQPNLHGVLEATYATQDWGEIAVRYMTEKTQWALSGPSRNVGLLDGIKPSDLGARSIIDLDVVAEIVKDNVPGADSGASLWRLVRDGKVTRQDVEQTLTDLGADPEFARRVGVTVGDPYNKPAEFWSSIEDLMGKGNTNLVRNVRRIWQARANVMGITEDELLHRVFADVPMGATSDNLRGLSAAERSAFLFMADVTDDALDLSLNRVQIPGTQEFMDWADNVEYAMREHAVLTDESGAIVARTQHYSNWTQGVDQPIITNKGIYERPLALRGYPLDAHIDPIPEDWIDTLGKDKAFWHNHPDDVGVSPADILMGIRMNARQMASIGPNRTSIMVRPEGGWFTPQMIALGLDPDVPLPLLRQVIDARWRQLQDEFAQSLKAWARDYAPEIDVHRVDARALDLALNQMANELGWEYHSLPTVRKPLDDVAYLQKLQEAADFMPYQWHETLRRVEPMQTVDVSSGAPTAQIAVEVSPGYGSQYASEMAWDSLDLAQQRQVTDAFSRWTVQQVSDLTGAVPLEMRSSTGWWWNPDTQALEISPSAVIEFAGSKEDVQAATAALGYLHQQSGVLGSRVVRINESLREIQNPATERWAIEFRTTARNYSDTEMLGMVSELDEAIRMTKDHPLTDTGATIVRAQNGKLAIRVILPEEFSKSMPHRLDFRDEIYNKAYHGMTKAWGAKWGLEGDFFPVEVVESWNDWTSAADGAGHLDTLRGLGRTAEAEQLAGRTGVQAREHLAGLVRGVAPDNPATAHLAGRGGIDALNPALTTRGSSRLRVVLPGGVDRLLRDPASLYNPYSLGEQVMLRAQRIDADALFRVNPDLATLIYDRGIFPSKYVANVALNSPDVQFNKMLFAALTPQTDINLSEGLWSLLRANEDTIYPGGALDAVQGKAYSVAGLIPPEYAHLRTDPLALGRAQAIQQGYLLDAGRWSDFRYVGGMDDAINYLDEETADALDWMVRNTRGMNEAETKGFVQQAIRNGKNPTGGPDEIVLAKNRRAVAERIEVLPFPISDSFLALQNPNTTARNASTYRAMGNATLWLTDGPFSRRARESEGLVNFMRVQNGEARSDWALRMATVTPGLAAKTGQMTVLMSGTREALHGVLDTHTMRALVQRASRNGDLDRLLSQSSETLANDIRSNLIRDGQFRSPEVRRIPLPGSRDIRTRLRSEDPEVVREAVDDMRRRLYNADISDEMRALYDDDEVLRLVGLYSGGKDSPQLLTYGGDYKVWDDYLTEVRLAEADTVGGAAGERIRSWSNGQYQWFLWDRQRGIVEPHMVMTKGIAGLDNQRMSALQVASALDARKSAAFPRPSALALWMQRDGEILGANVLLKDARRLMLLTDKSTKEAVLHEIVHGIEATLDPSMRKTLIGIYNAETNHSTTIWHRGVSEWFVEAFMQAAESGMKGVSPDLRPALEYIRNMLRRTNDAVWSAERRQAAAEARTAAIAKARTTATEASRAARKAETELAKLSAKRNTANRALISARSKTSSADLIQRQFVAQQTADRLTEAIKEQKALLRTLRAETKLTAAKIKEGGRSAGGLTASLHRQEARVLELADEIADLEKQAVKAHRAAADAGAKVRGAAKRTPLETHEKVAAESRAAVKAQARKVQEARAAERKALQDLDNARALPVRAKGRRPKPAVSDDVSKAFREILREPPVQTRPNSGQLMGVPFDPQQEAVYQAGRFAVSRAEEQAFTTQYYKRGRSFVERSVNHPYFGLYPSSYMWGKVLPEMVRFLVKYPFGIPAPFGGLALSNAVYRQIMLQQNFDPNFRKAMIENNGLWHFVSMLTPALPWEIPANAPLWSRRLAEASAEHEYAKAQGIQKDLMSPEQFGQTVTDMLIYAFGPAYTTQQLGVAVGALQEAGGDVFQQATDTLSGVFGGTPETPGQQPQVPQFQPTVR